MGTLPIRSVILAAAMAANPLLWAQTAPEISLPPGDAARGKAVFTSTKANCQSCHRVQGTGWVATFTDPIKGTSGFAAEFEKQGLRDSHGRSLKDLDLQRRLLKYPMSYLIYSPSFDAMPASVRDFVYLRFRKILSGEDKSQVFAHLTEADRNAILGILQETKPEFSKIN